MAAHLRVGQSSPVFAVSSAIETFQNKLYATVKDLGLGEENWDSHKWSELVPLVTQEYLNSVHFKIGEVAGLFQLIEEGQPPPPPNMDHIFQQIKMDFRLSHMPIEDAVHHLKREHFLNYYFYSSHKAPLDLQHVLNKHKERLEKNTGFFTVINDFLSYSIPFWNLDGIPAAIEHIRKIAENEGGLVHVQGKSRWGQCINEHGKWGDIVQLVHVYLPQYGLIEFQITHPLARYAFDHKRELSLETRGFYQLAKQYLVDEANGFFHSEDVQIMRQNKLLQTAIKIHKEAHIPLDDELKLILNEICKREIFEFEE